MATTLDLLSTARALVSAPRNRRFLAFLPAPLLWLSKRLVTFRATGSALPGFRRDVFAAETLPARSFQDGSLTQRAAIFYKKVDGFIVARNHYRSLRSQ